MKRIPSSTTSITTSIFWEENTCPNRDKAVVLVKKNDLQEKEKLKNGWRWVPVHKNHKILVPCDKQGNPTPEGEKKIQKFQEMYHTK